MKLQAIGTLAGLVAALFNAPAIGQTADTVEAHIAAARAAAGEHHPGIFDGLCMSQSRRLQDQDSGARHAQAGRRAPLCDRQGRRERLCEGRRGMRARKPAAREIGDAAARWKARVSA